MPRKAYSIDTMLREIAEHAPHRYTASDGWLGDPAHAARKSDHNPNALGVVRAVDVTNDPDDHDGDPTNDLPGQWLADRLASMLGKHPALGSGAYVIFNRRIISTDRLDEGWRPYTGPNAHKTHVHLSVATAAAGYDNRTPFDLWENDMDPNAVWDVELVNVQPDGTRKKQPAKALLADIELNVDNQASRLARVEKKLDRLLAALENK